MSSTVGLQYSHNDVVTCTCNTKGALGVPTIRAWQESLRARSLIRSAGICAFLFSCRGGRASLACASTARGMTAEGTLLRLRQRRTCGQRDLCCAAGSLRWHGTIASQWVGMGWLPILVESVAASNLMYNTTKYTWGGDVAPTWGSRNHRWMHCTASALQRRSRLLGHRQCGRCVQKGGRLLCACCSLCRLGE